MGIPLINFFIAYLVFAQKTAHPLEKKIKKAGGELPQWDNMGLRIPGYATALLMPIKAKSAQLVDEDLIKKFATKGDYLRAKYFLLSLLIVFLPACTGYLIFN